MNSIITFVYIPLESRKIKFSGVFTSEEITGSKGRKLKRDGPLRGIVNIYHSLSKKRKKPEGVFIDIPFVSTETVNR